jgi:AAA15 family ATPase/GTPase
MLKSFHAQGFKSLLDVQLELPRFSVVFGANAAGKSNLLDAFQTLARLGTEKTIVEALGPPVRGYPAEMFTLPG